jgi:hypothetical protein
MQAGLAAALHCAINAHSLSACQHKNGPQYEYHCKGMAISVPRCGIRAARLCNVPIRYSIPIAWVARQ